MAERFSRDRVLEIATDRWAAILATRPDLQPAVALQRRLVLVLIDLAQVFSAGRLPRLSLPPKYLSAKLSSGVPVLAGEPIPVPVAVLTAPLLRLCSALAEGGAGEPAEHIRAALERGQIEVGSLLSASLARDQQAIRTGATHRGLSPDLMWLVAELVVSPFAHALQQALFPRGLHGEAPRAEAPRVEALAAALGTWRRGYCPACGSWPALAEVVSGHRILRCSFCAAVWELPTSACVYCEEAGERFVIAAPDGERRDRRVELCGSCTGYLKTVNVPDLSPFPLLAISDLETMDLDVVAMERGYARRGLKEFARARS